MKKKSIPNWSGILTENGECSNCVGLIEMTLSHKEVAKERKEK